MRMLVCTFVVRTHLGQIFSRRGPYDIMVLSELAKSGLESGAWVDKYDYHNKDKNHYHYKT